MTVEYRIIWVDDSPDWVNSVIGEVEEHLQDADCQPVIDRLEDSAGVVEKCKELDYDLLIVDYQLPTDDGTFVISKIREAEKFTEVVFYSQDQPSTQLIGVMDGVFHCQRADAVAKIKSVIDLTLHKLRDLGVVRGLIIASAIDIEVRLEELIIKVFKDSGLLFRERVLDKQYLDCAKKHALLQGVVNELMEKAEGEAEEKLKVVRDVLKTLDAEVVDQRNILAHSKRVERNGKIVLEGINKRTKEVVFDTQWLAKTRTDFRKHLRNLDAIDVLLGPSVDEQIPVNA